jgi:hypothetical protein
MSEQTVYVKPRAGMIDKIALTLCLGAAALIIMNMYFPDAWLRLTGRPAVNCAGACPAHRRTPRRTQRPRCPRFSPRPLR